MRAHGNWCGPNWTAGQYKPTTDLTDTDRKVPAIDALDRACKKHDIMLHDYPENADEINELFITEVNELGIKGKLFGLAVAMAGPSPITQEPGLDLREDGSSFYINLGDSHIKMPKKKSSLAKNYEQHQVQERQRLGLDESKDDDESLGFGKAFVEGTKTEKRRATEFVTPNRQSNKKQKISPEERIISSDGQSSNPRKQFPWESLSNLTRGSNTTNAIMAEEEFNQDVDMMRSGGSSVMTGEQTKVTYATPNYQLADTHTTVLPVTFYCSGVLQAYRALDFTLRMNCIENPLVTLISDVPPPNTFTGVTLGAPFTKGLYSRKIPYSTSFGTNYSAVADGPLKAEINDNNYWQIGELPNGSRWPVQSYFFPNQLTSNQQPGMFQKDWYTKLYDFWTVLGCDYEIIMEVTHANSPLFNNDVIVASKIDTDSTTNSGDRIPNDMSLNDLKYVKNISFKTVKASRSDANEKTVIKGQYTPGSVKGMVSNDGEVKKWTQTGVAQTYREDLHLMIFPHEFNNYCDTNIRTVRESGTSTWITDTTPVKTCMNMQITLKYLVQYKDLKSVYRYREIGFVPTPPTTNDLLYSDYATKRVVTSSM